MESRKMLQIQDSNGRADIENSLWTQSGEEEGGMN